jgi:hypothetical protein
MKYSLIPHNNGKTRIPWRPPDEWLRAAMKRTLNSRDAVFDFAALAQRGDTIIFYYSGHGVSRPTDRFNYLIPVDAVLENDFDVDDDAVVPARAVDRHVVLEDVMEHGLGIPLPGRSVPARSGLLERQRRVSSIGAVVRSHFWNDEFFTRFAVTSQAKS